jgi:hypothetical protein
VKKNLDLKTGLFHFSRRPRVNKPQISNGFDIKWRLLYCLNTSKASSICYNCLTIKRHRPESLHRVQNQYPY